MAILEVKVRSKRRVIKGWAVLRFENGALTDVRLRFKGGLTDAQWAAFRNALPQTSDGLAAMEPLGLEVIEKDGEKTTDMAKRLALWCKLYRVERGAAYRATGKDVAMLAQVPVTAELITAYLRCDEWWARANSIGEYVSRINQVQQLGANGQVVRRFPNDYQRDYDFKLSDEDRRLYYRHLYDLGWRKEYSGAVGDVWREPDG
jgi:hypothetical protein